MASASYGKISKVFEKDFLLKGLFSNLSLKANELRVNLKFDLKLQHSGGCFAFCVVRGKT